MINEIHIKDILLQLNEPLIIKGKRIVWDKHHSVDFNENKWYQHSRKIGGYPIQFLMTFFNMSYNESVVFLQSEFNTPHINRTSKLTIPKFDEAARNITLYLEHFRFIDSKIIKYFLDHKLIAQHLIKGHCLFLGLDNQNEIVHIHERSTHLNDFIVQKNQYGSNSNFSFNLIGKSETLYVFESPVDLLSYISLNQGSWEAHSYVALCGLSSKVIHSLLETYPHLNKVRLALDNDYVGIEASTTILKELKEIRGVESQIELPVYKDFNEDLKHLNGLPAQSGFYAPFDLLRKKTYKKIVDSLTTSKQVTFKDLTKSFSKYLYLVKSDSTKQRNIGIEALLSTAILALKLAEQQASHLEMKGFVIDAVLNFTDNPNHLIKYVDTSPKYTTFLKYLSLLKTEFKTKIVHTKEDKELIIETLINFTKTCVDTYVFLILRKDRINESK